MMTVKLAGASDLLSCIFAKAILLLYALVKIIISAPVLKSDAVMPCYDNNVNRCE